MADDLDPTLEARLRDTLHAEADGVALTVRGAELRRAAAERRRASRTQRLGLLAAAASILVVLGGGVLVATARPDGSVAASPSAGASVAVSPSARVEPSATPVALASFAELEGIVAQNGIGERIFGEAEQPQPVPGDGRTGTTLAEVPSYQFLDIFISCTGGSYAIDVIAAGARPSDPPDKTFGFESECGDHPLVITDGNSSDRPASVVIRTMGPVAWRAVVGGWLPAGATPSPSAPPPAKREPGETPLVRFDVVAGGEPLERTATVPAGTEELYLTAPCAGEGDLDVTIDGVVATYGCGGVGTQVFVPSRTGAVVIRASATGTAAFALRLGAVDWAQSRPGTWRPPALRVSGPDATAGDTVGLTAYPGCGWSWQPKDGSGFVDDCGPSWQPMPDALAQRVGTSVTLALDGGWAITDVQAEVAANAEIQPSGRSPLAQAWVVTRAADGTFALAVPAPGDWGVKLLVSGERDGDRFQVPYYARVIVDGP